MKASEKIRGRIAKLLKLANSTGSPEESAIAANRVRKMMDKYQLTEGDFDLENDDDIITEDYKTKTKSVPITLRYMSTALAKLNDCQTRMKRNRITGKMSIVFFGYSSDVLVCTQTLDFLVRQMYDQAERLYTTRAERGSYKMGFASGVCDNLQEMLEERKEVSASSSTDLVVCKNEMVSAKYGVVKYSNSSQRPKNYSEYNEGVVDGQNAGLNTRVENE